MKFVCQFFFLSIITFTFSFFREILILVLKMAENYEWIGVRKLDLLSFLVVQSFEFFLVECTSVGIFCPFENLTIPMVYGPAADSNGRGNKKFQQTSSKSVENCKKLPVFVY